MRAEPTHAVRSEHRCCNESKPLARDISGGLHGRARRVCRPSPQPSRNERGMVPCMPVALDFSIPPFEHLTAEQRHKLSAAADIAFLRPGAVLTRAGEAPAHLYLIVKGLVSE